VEAVGVAALGGRPALARCGGAGFKANGAHVGVLRGVVEDVELWGGVLRWAFGSDDEYDVHAAVHELELEEEENSVVYV
jgi:hypothetical protein